MNTPPMGGADLVEGVAGLPDWIQFYEEAMKAV
jgi:hypothetical protein